MRRLPDWIDGWLEFQKNSESPLLFRKWVAISMISSALSRKVWHMWEGPVYPNFFICLVGPSGEARKGTAMRPANAFLETMDVYTAAESTTRESLIEQLEEGTQTITTDEQTLVYNAITVFSEEFTVFLNYKDERFMADLCDLYDCKARFRYVTKRSGSNYLRNVFLNIIGATTPKTLKDSLPSLSIGGGLLSRIILVYADKGQTVVFPHRVPIDQSLQDDLIHDYQDLLMESGEYTFTPEWDYLYEKWYPTQKDEIPFEHDYANSYSSRRSLHLRKLCMVMCASRGGEKVVTADDFKRAHSLLLETEDRMGRVFMGVGKSELAEVQAHVLFYIQNKGMVGVTLVEIVRHFWQDATRDQLSTIMATLEMMGVIERFEAEDGDLRFKIK